MSTICNGGPPDPKPKPNVKPSGLITTEPSLATEYEVEQGSAALANSFRSILSAVSAIELHAIPTVPTYFQAALEASKVALQHYEAVIEIDPNRGADQHEQAAIRALDLSSAIERWNNQNLVPNIGNAVEELRRAAVSGHPAKLLEAFTIRLRKTVQYLDKLNGSPPLNNKAIQWDTWVAISMLVDTMMTGQMIAIINREARELLDSA
jgi:hypothetical protein